MYAGLYISVWLLGNVLIVGVFDIIAFFFLTPEETVSFWVQRWLQAFPILGVALGVVIGHLAWPLHRNVPVGRE